MVVIARGRGDSVHLQAEVDEFLERDPQGEKRVLVRLELRLPLLGCDPQASASASSAAISSLNSAKASRAAFLPRVLSLRHAMPVFLVLCVRSPVSSSMRLTTACHLPLFFLTDPLPHMRKSYCSLFRYPFCSQNTS